jgi:hypothetical protein
MTMAQLEGLGWQWRENGVVLCVQISGRKMQVFVPLNRVWHAFASEMAKVGCPFNVAVGEPITVSGLFGSIVHAVSSVAKAVVPQAIQKAATTVVNTAKSYATHALNAVTSIPLIGPLAQATTSMLTQPLQIAEQLAKGGRIDRVAFNSLKTAIANAKTVAPYAQAVLSFVPGVGQGLSGAIGAAAALASGQSINEAMLAAVKGALPGGPLAQSAFSVATDAMQGKPITDIALNAIPGMTPAQKNAVKSAVSIAQSIAKGQNVQTGLADALMKQLPPDAAKAIQLGIALGHAKSIQGAAGTIASMARPPSLSSALNAAKLQSLTAAGNAAAKAIQAGQVTPQALTAVQNGLAAKSAFSSIFSQATAGHPVAQEIVTAMQRAVPTPPAAAVLKGARPRVGAPFIPRYSQNQNHAAVGALLTNWRHPPQLAQHHVSPPAQHAPSWMRGAPSIFNPPRQFRAAYAR